MEEEGGGMLEMGLVRKGEGVDVSVLLERRERWVGGCSVGGEDWDVGVVGGHDRMRSRYGFDGRAARRNKEMMGGFGYFLSMEICRRIGSRSENMPMSVCCVGNGDGRSCDGT